MGPLFMDHVYCKRRSDWKTGSIVEKMRQNEVRLGHIPTLPPTLKA